jgi:hypothetical protein
MLLLEIFKKMTDISERLVYQTQPIKMNHEARKDVTTGLTNIENEVCDTIFPGDANGQ